MRFAERKVAKGENKELREAITARFALGKTKTWDTE